MLTPACLTAWAWQACWPPPPASPACPCPQLWFTLATDYEAAGRMYRRAQRLANRTRQEQQLRRKRALQVPRARHWRQVDELAPASSCRPILSRLPCVRQQRTQHTWTYPNGGGGARARGGGKCLCVCVRVCFEKGAGGRLGKTASQPAAGQTSCSAPPIPGVLLLAAATQPVLLAHRVAEAYGASRNEAQGPCGASRRSHRGCCSLGCGRQSQALDNAGKVLALRQGGAKRRGPLAACSTTAALPRRSTGRARRALMLSLQLSLASGSSAQAAAA